MRRILQYGMTVSFIMFFAVLTGMGQTTLAPGDIAITGVNMDNPDEISVVFLVDIESGTEIKFSDNGWKADNTWRTGEGTHTWTASAAYSAGDEIVIVLIGPALSTSGDQVIAFQNTSDMVGAINDEGSHVWQSDATSSNTSTLPLGLTNGTNCVALDETDNIIYNRSVTAGTKEEILTAINDYTNWSGDDATRQTLSTAGFTITNVTSPTITTSTTTLSGFSYVINSGPSPEQSFIVEGSNLTGNISIDAPVNYEISETSGGTFGTNISIIPSNGSVTNKTIYVRLNQGLAVGPYDNEIIDIATPGAVDKSIECNGNVFNDEPTNNPTGLTATTVNSYNEITLVWTDSDAEGYLIKGSDISYNDITMPADGIPESDGTLVQNITSGIESFQFTGLLPSTTYYFKNYPYNGSGATINYKLDGPVPQDEAQTLAPPASPNVFFSEYIEGTGNNKAIEIYNASGSTIDLSEYTVKLGANGETWGNTITLSGSLAAGDVYVIYNLAAGPGIQAVGDVSSEVTYYNGNDALGLFYTAILIDVIGNPGTDPGSSWDVAGVAGATKEHTLIRKLSVVEGNTNWASSAGTGASNSEWVVQGQDYFNNLGFFGTAWMGDISTNWATSGNWDVEIPTSSYNVSIPDVGPTSATFPIIDGSAAVANLTMATGSSLDIASSGELTVNGTFINNGTLTIKSDASGTGSLIETSGVSANIERFLTSNNWHYVSSPVSSLVSDVFDGLYLMEWDEPTESWIDITDLGVTLNPCMQGYSVWANTASTVIFQGTTNAGAKSIDLTNYVNAPLFSSGYNFVGNPYPSGVDWDADDGSGWTRTNVGSSIYIWNPSAGNYGVYERNTGSSINGVSNEIPPHQGFFVWCDDEPATGEGSGVLAVDNAARIHTNQEIFKGGKKITEYIKLSISGNNYNDETIFGINTGSGINFDSQFDAKKFNGSEDAPQLYSITNDGKRVSINSLPEVTSNMSIPIGFQAGVEEIYKITISELYGFDETPLYLEDLLENTIVDIKSDDYNFLGLPDDMPDRFLLHFFNPEANGLTDTPSNNSIFVFALNNTIKIISDKPFSGEVKVYNIVGQEVVSNRLGSASDHEISMADKSGYFIVNLVSGRGVVNKKVYLSQ